MESLVKAIHSENLAEIKTQLDDPKISTYINQIDSEMKTPFFHAALLNNQDLAIKISQMLIEKGADPYYRQDNRQTVLYFLASQGKAKTLEFLLKNFEYNLNQTDKFDQNPLYWAAKMGKLKVAQILLRYGVDINHKDHHKETCLFFAASNGHLEVCKFLINRGCHHEYVGGLGKAALFYARYYKQKAVVEYLVGLKSKNKAKEESKEVSSEKVVVKKKKEKQVIRNEYVLAYTNEDGQVKQLTLEEIVKFKQISEENSKIYQLITNPKGLEKVQTKNQKKFLKTALKVVNQLIKRQDLSVFCEPVNLELYTDYLTYVDQPMDYSTVKVKLNHNCYQQQAEFLNDLYRVSDNCIKYNGGESAIGKMANQLKFEIAEMYRKQCFA